MTKWAGQAWRDMHSDVDFVKKLFEKTGCPKGLTPETL